MWHTLGHKPHEEIVKYSGQWDHHSLRRSLLGLTVIMFWVKKRQQLVTWPSNLCGLLFLDYNRKIFRKFFCSWKIDESSKGKKIINNIILQLLIWYTKVWIPVNKNPSGAPLFLHLSTHLNPLWRIHNTEAKYKKQTNVRNIVISLRVLTSLNLWSTHLFTQLSPFAKVQ